MKFLNFFQDKDLSNKICLLRVDFNIEDAEIFKDSFIHPRISAVIPTLKFLTDKGAKVVLLSHRGRPYKKYQVSSIKNQEFGLRPFVKIISKKLNRKVNFVNNFNFNGIKQKIKNSSRGDIFLLENIRFLSGEEKNDEKLAKRLASLGDFFVNDAFGVSHRNAASVSAITKFLPSYAGFQLEKEIKNLSAAAEDFKKPLVVILGGAKISDKIGLIKNFSAKADYFLTGGGIGNTLIKANGLPIGDSLCEEKMLDFAKKLLKNEKVVLPADLVVYGGKILDIGPKTVENYSLIIKKAKTVVWNGPLGLVENKRFASGSEKILKAVVKSGAFAVIGGGETTSLASSIGYQVSSKIFLSTGGGAMLEFLAGKKLPGIVALKKSADSRHS